VAAGGILLLSAATGWGSPVSEEKAVDVSASTVALVHAPIQNETLSGSKATSVNWAGYANTGAAGVTPAVTFSGVIGSWVQPAVTCTNVPAESAFWVGIDGFLKGSSTVEQIGTDSDCDKKNKKLKTGGPTYYAWWEMYPAASNTITTTGSSPQYPVAAGDTMTAEVTVTGSSFTLTLKDSTQGWSFTTTQMATTPESSAEWIVEAPSKCVGCAPLKLANFGSVTFSSISDTPSTSDSSDITAWPINMTKGKKLVKASTMRLTQSSFVVTWHHD
jgi:hypothetical protein